MTREQELELQLLQTKLELARMMIQSLTFEGRILQREFEEKKASYSAKPKADEAPPAVSPD